MSIAVVQQSQSKIQLVTSDQEIITVFINEEEFVLGAVRAFRLRNQD